MQLGWSLFAIFAALIAKSLSDWRSFLLYTFTIPSFMLTIPVFFMVNSPKFAYISSKEEAVDLLNRIGRINGKRPLDHHQLASHHQHKEKKQTLGMVHLFKYKSVRKSILIAASLYFIIQMQYYGSVLTQGYLEGDLYDQVIFGALVDTAANLFATFYGMKVRRRPLLFVCYVLITLLQTSCLLEGDPMYQVVVNIAARCLITVCCDFTILHIEEVFPTSIKNSAIGFYFTFGLLGGVLAPFVVTFS